jgi:hypothetical protein
MLKVLLTSLLIFVRPTAVPAALPAWAEARWKQAELSKSFSFATYAKPSYLQADFNGDGKLDVAVLITRRATGSSGILIFHQDQPTHYVVGTGSNTSTNMLHSNFEWVDYWNLFTKASTLETLFDKSGDISGERTIQLKHSAIEIGKEETGGGMIYWNGKKYIWIHQTC